MSSPSTSTTINAAQPEAATAMKVMKPTDTGASKQAVHEEHGHRHHKASRIRGGGAAKASPTGNRRTALSASSHALFAVNVARAVANVPPTSFVSCF
ncbi:hypothetical protein MD484_g7889, partial [Candolleomyces efflorescens]